MRRRAEGRYGVREMRSVQCGKCQRKRRKNRRNKGGERKGGQKCDEKEQRAEKMKGGIS